MSDKPDQPADRPHPEQPPGERVRPVQPGEQQPGTTDAPEHADQPHVAHHQGTTNHPALHPGHQATPEGQANQEAAADAEQHASTGDDARELQPGEPAFKSAAGGSGGTGIPGQVMPPATGESTLPEAAQAEAERHREQAQVQGDPPAGRAGPAARTRR